MKKKAKVKAIPDKHHKVVNLRKKMIAKVTRVKKIMRVHWMKIKPETILENSVNKQSL